MSQASVAEIFASELEAAREMRDCLLQEQAHLISANVAALAPISAQKDQIVLRLNKLAHARNLALSASGFDLTDVGMRQWLGSLSKEVQQEWKTLMSVVADSKELNRTNGLLINQHLVRVQKALQSLNGSRSPEVYGRNGQHHASTSTRTIVAT